MRLSNDFRCYLTNLRRGYSVFPPSYVQPIYRKEDQDALFQTEEAKKIMHVQIKPATVTDTCSEFYDKRVLWATISIFFNADFRTIYYNLSDCVQKIYYYPYEEWK